MMLRNSPSHLFGHRRSLSETHLENELSSPALGSAKSLHSISSCTFRRTLSQSNLIPPLARNEHSHHSMRKWRCSQKNGLLIAGDELAKVAVHDKRKDPLKWENKAHGNSIFFRPTKKEDKALSIDMKAELLDGNSSVCGNGMVEENYSSLEAGLNGMVLICTEKGCRPTHPSETEYANHGKDSNRIGSKQGSSGADSNETDVYYQKMLELNPENPFLLTNYAKFLDEVKNDVEKAEKHYKRALMASPGDGQILSMYAKFIWDSHNDAAQAEVYYRKAVKVAPEDCYVVASYAHFLWNSDDDEEEEVGPSAASMKLQHDVHIRVMKFVNILVGTRCKSIGMYLTIKM